jgi:hypothetical protein
LEKSARIAWLSFWRWNQVFLVMCNGAVGARHRFEASLTQRFQR